MLASSPVRIAGERVAGAGLAAAAATVVTVFCALFFANGDDARLVGIGALALATAALSAGAALVGLAPAVRVDRLAGAFLGFLLGLVAWTGASTLWSLSPERTWGATNRTLVYAAFAVVGLVLGGWLPRPATAGARAAAALLGLVFAWALLAKCVPALYSDYGRVARLRAPLGYWNELALLGAVAVPVALWLASPRTRPAGSRAAGAVLLYGAVVVTLLTYSRVGVILAVLAAAGWTALSSDRVESLAASALAGSAGAAVFGAALALPGITDDAQPRSVRAHDGWVFAVAVVAGAVAVAAAAVALARLEARRPLSAARRRMVERAAASAAALLVAAAVALSAVFAGRIWNEFANPATSQLSSGSSRALSLNSSNRWRWWQEEWQAFTEQPLSGTGADTFQLTDFRLRQSSLVTTAEPHNTPLQLLGELGIVGLLLYLGAAAAAGAGIVAARRRASGSERAAVTALGLGLAAFLVHTVVDMDWSFVAPSGPLLLVAGLVLGRERTAKQGARPARRPLVAVAAVLVAAGGVYSLAAPWLARRALARATTPADFRRAHSYDPLSTEVLSDWAAAEEARGNLGQALKLYRDATALEPENGSTWFDLGTFYAAHGDWERAYEALSTAWRYDPQGPAGVPCGPLDQARHAVLGTWPASCPRGSRPAASP